MPAPSAEDDDVAGNVASNPGASAEDSGEESPEIISTIEATVSSFKRIFDHERLDDLKQLEYSQNIYREKENNAQGVERWAKDLAVAIRNGPGETEETKAKFIRAKDLSQCRKRILALLYEMVVKWIEYEDQLMLYQRFGQTILQQFTYEELLRILSACLPFDRANALYGLRSGTVVGKMWISQYHLDANREFYASYPDEFQKWKSIREARYAADWRAPMNRKLFRILFHNQFGFQEDNDLRKWSMPAEVPSLKIKPVLSNDQSSDEKQRFEKRVENYEVLERIDRLQVDIQRKQFDLGDLLVNFQEQTTKYQKQQLQKQKDLEELLLNFQEENAKYQEDQLQVLRSISNGVYRCMGALTFLAREQVKKCPTLVYVIPDNAFDYRKDSRKTRILNLATKKKVQALLCMPTHSRPSQDTRGQGSEQQPPR
mmetsp:Transcript_13783/g.38073  ORF Transcript_13783/g.38073 Transcript_13783/m.38073 type:complete len:429 (+) Transcript_13783:63-1349(+)